MKTEISNHIIFISDKFILRKVVYPKHEMHVDKASSTDVIQNNYFLEFNLKKTQQQQQEFSVHCCICHLFGTLFDDGAHIPAGGGGGGGGGIVGCSLGSVGMSGPDFDGGLGDLSLSLISIKIIIIIAVNFHDEYMYEVKKHNLPSFAQNNCEIIRNSCGLNISLEI